MIDILEKSHSLMLNAAMHSYDKQIDGIKSECLVMTVRSIKKSDELVTCEEIYRNTMLTLLYAAKDKIDTMISDIGDKDE